VRIPTLTACLILAAAPSSAETVTVAAARLLDVEAGRLLADTVVEIDDGVITAVGPGRAGQPVTHDLGDVTLVPGLIDVHVHLIGRIEETPFERLVETTARAAIEGVANAKATIEAGFTTVRDLGARDVADIALRDAIAQGRVLGPRMLVAVKSISSTGGHGDRNDLPDDVEVHRISAIADGPEEVRRRVRENCKRGADWIKVLATGGVMSAGTDPRMADYTEEELRAAVESAAAKGRDVAVHAHGTEGIRRALLAGARSIEHASMLDDATIALAKERGAFVVPNPFTNAWILERGAAGGYQPYQVEKSRQVYTAKLESLRAAVRAGVQVAYGTDSGVQPHGMNGRQLRVFVEAGMTPLDAIRSATLVNARLLRMDGKVGVLRPGAFGDIVAVPGNPLVDVTVVERPAFVMKGGRVIVGDRR